jgi:hypothetical protein
MFPFQAAGEGAIGGMKAVNVVGDGKVTTVCGAVGAFCATESGRAGVIVKALGKAKVRSLAAGDL